MFPYEWILQARERIQAHIKPTPLTYDPDLDVYIKWENRQATGSFKARGALNKLLSMQAWELESGIITASAGNHGQGVAFAGDLLGASVIVYVGDTAVRAKVEAMRAYGAEIRSVPGGFGEAETAALAFVKKSGGNWVSAYNDPQVIAGQGTLALEVLEQLPDGVNPVWLVPVSGGGLIAGVGAALKEGAARDVTLAGVQSDTSAFMYALFHRASQDAVVELPSIADGLAGPVEANSITIPLVRKYLDDLILVGEEEIIAAVRYAWERYGERIEGSGAVPLAAVLTGKISARPAVLIVSGGNIQPELHRKIVSGEVFTIGAAWQILQSGTA